MSLQEMLGTIKQQGYASIKIYTQGTEVKFVQLQSNLQRKPFLLQFPCRYSINSTKTDHILNEIQGNYRSYRQEEYLKKILLQHVACLSERNLCIKNDNIITCYLLDSILDSDSYSELNNIDSDGDDSNQDIEIDDYPVKDIYPVFNIMSFMKNITDFEDQVTKSYYIIHEAEEKMNETEVEQLLQLFDKQKEQVKERIFVIHKEAYNIRRDISNVGAKLQRIYELKKNSEIEKDRIRFRLDRLSIEAEAQLDTLNSNLYEKRDKADVLLKRYLKYIEQFTWL